MYGRLKLGSAMAKTSAQPILNKRASILVIDDNSEMADLISRIVRHIGFEHVDYAADPLKAILMMGRFPYDLIISDWRMDPITGLDLLRFVRTDRALRGTRFLIMTARRDHKDVMAARDAGVDNFILKPFTPEALEAKISAVL
jgi:two-component system chemotaxis response regulator CheY